MGLCYRNELPTYNNCYHFVGKVKYSKSVFMSNEIRERLKNLINQILVDGKGIKVHSVAVAYNHIHVLVEGELEPSKIGMILFGATSRIMRREYPELKDQIEKSLWGGKSCTYIKDEEHLKHAISYINRHRPDNTKVD